MRLVFTGAALAFASIGVALLAACAGNPGSSSMGLPMLVSQRTAGIDRPVLGTTTTLDIVVGRSPKGVTRARSVTVRSDGSAKKQTFSLAAGPHCKSVHGALNCAFPLTLEAGTHQLEITTTAGSRRLSNDGMFVSIGDCAKNVVSLALYEPSASLAVVPESPWIRGSLHAGFKTELDQALFSIVLLDAAKATIIGSTVASPTVKSSNAKITVANPSPNAFVLEVAKSAPFDTVVASKITVSAMPLHAAFRFSDELTTLPTPTPTPSPAPCTTPTPSAPPTQRPTATPSPSPPPAGPAAVFVTYSQSGSTGSVVAYDEEGNVKTISGGWTSEGNPTSIIWDPNIVWFYLVATTNGQSGPIEVYGQQGSHLAEFTFPESTAVALADDSHLNRIYIADQTTIHAYGEDGGSALSLNPGFPTTNLRTSFAGLAFDSNSNHLYVGNLATGTVGAYDESGNAVSLSGTFAAPQGSVCGSSCQPSGLTFDPQNDTVYIVWTKSGSTGGTVVGYNESGDPTVSSAFAGLVNPVSIAVDSHNGLLYVVDGTAVKVYNAQGIQQKVNGTFAPPFTPTSANAVTIIPPPGAI